jgi:ubiquinone/menaquinone biosynthesis C-methylase UbiE
MSNFKDNFSAQAEQYANFRPGYPDELFEFIYKHCNAFGKVWDCATGNGQAATHLAEKFTDVHATDISQKQIDNATQLSNIHYSVQSANSTSFADSSFDLITIAQALHWFANDDFYNEAIRVAKDDAVIAAFGYNLLYVNEEIDELVKDFYTNIVGSYWDAERTHVDNEYRSISFPFAEIPCPAFDIQYNWTIKQMLGYLSSWSSVQHYKKKNDTDPVALIEKQLDKSWPPGVKHTVTFPIFMRMGRVKK